MNPKTRYISSIVIFLITSCPRNLRTQTIESDYDSLTTESYTMLGENWNENYLVSTTEKTIEISHNPFESFAYEICVPSKSSRVFAENDNDLKFYVCSQLNSSIIDVTILDRIAEKIHQIIDKRFNQAFKNHKFDKGIESLDKKLSKECNSSEITFNHTEAIRIEKTNHTEWIRTDTAKKWHLEWFLFLFLQIELFVLAWFVYRTRINRCSFFDEFSHRNPSNFKANRYEIEPWKENMRVIYDSRMEIFDQTVAKESKEHHLFWARPSTPILKACSKL
ncbi:hypothetical protein NH340_JMT08418 [Sarcoptes scabiei]|nr:hypothetical protein NH340_JMT08418 [Sarcoptes scabiei]